MSEPLHKRIRDLEIQAAGLDEELAGVEKIVADLYTKLSVVNQTIAELRALLPLSPVAAVNQSNSRLAQALGRMKSGGSQTNPRS